MVFTMKNSRRIPGTSGLVPLSQFSLTFTSTYWVDTTRASDIALRVLDQRYYWDHVDRIRH